MRMNTLLALTLLSLASLGGCLGFGGDESPDTDDHDDHDHDDHDHGNETDNGTVEPNVPPTASLRLVGPDGSELGPRTAVMVGQNITFSANGSADPDGILALAALTVFDGSGTRTVSMLQGGALVDVSLPIEKEGNVTAVLRVLDEDGDGAVAAAFTYANVLQTKDGELKAPAPPDSAAGTCEGATTSTAQGSLIDNHYSTAQTFNTVNGTRWISAKVTSGNVDITICSPEKEALSGTGSEVSTAEGDYAPGVKHYLFVVNRGSVDETWSVEWISHWEPKPE